MLYIWVLFFVVRYLSLDISDSVLIGINIRWTSSYLKLFSINFFRILVILLCDFWVAVNKWADIFRRRKNVDLIIILIYIFDIIVKKNEWSTEVELVHIWQKLFLGYLMNFKLWKNTKRPYFIYPFLTYILLHHSIIPVLLHQNW